jgi:hypothetical protein
LFGEKAPDPFQVRKNQQASTCADGEIWWNCHPEMIGNDWKNHHDAGDRGQNSELYRIMSFVLLLMYANAPMLLPLSSSLGKTNPCCNSCTKTCHLNSCQRKDQPFLTAWVLSISYIYTCPITTGTVYIYIHIGVLKKCSWNVNRDISTD